MGEMDQDDIDKLLADALGGDAGSFSFDDAAGGAQSQDEIDALIAAAAGGDDLPPGSSTTQPADTTDNDGAQSQDDIDALIAAATGGGEKTTTAPFEAPSAEEEPTGQGDVDALIAGMTGGGAEDTTAEEELGGQDSVDALIAGMTGGGIDDTAATEEPTGQDSVDALIAGMNAGSDSSEESGTQSQDDIDALIAAASDGGAATTTRSKPVQAAKSLGGSAASAADQFDIDALLATDNEETDSLAGAGALEEESDDAVDDLLGSFGGDSEEEEGEEDEESSEEELAGMTQAAEQLQKAIATPEVRIASAAEQKYVPPAMPKSPKIMPRSPASVPELSEAQLSNLQESLSLSGSSGEVENLAGQMSGLLGQLSERARRFQAAWLNTDQENRELHHRLMLAEQKIYAITGEKDSLLNENTSLRKNCSRVEGEKLASVEAHRTEIASLELKIREQESRNNMLESEVRSLKEELERARNDSTGSDLESRRARFELDRLNSELTAERQERSRLQRALDNREKELQAMQAQSAGHASTLFLDELHRLVRRLESELDIRTSAAHEALSVIDRIKFLPEQQMYATTLRASVSTACGLTPDEGDALANMDRQAVKGQKALEPQPAPGEDSFRTALERYDFARASGIASAQMRSGQRSPLDFMRELHGVEMLRRPEIVDKLDDLTALLRGIKSIQEASDRSRGRENDQTERLFVMIFDLLHALVRLKLISRATPAVWDLFLELRGRFSFLTSDRQWREYRDRILGAAGAAVA